MNVRVKGADKHAGAARKVVASPECGNLNSLPFLAIESYLYRPHDDLCGY
jgi:hypothetical protein